MGGMGGAGGMQMGMGGMAGMQMGMGGMPADQDMGPKVLLVNNLAAGCTADDVFKLCGVYGDVMRVKILFKKRDTAMAEFRDSTQARTCLAHLNDTPFRGLVVKVTTSKAAAIQMPGGASTNPERLTVDYAQAKGHRYAIPGSRNFKHIHAPNPCLHVSNIRDGEAAEAALQALFSAQGEVSSIRYLGAGKNGQKTQAFVTFASLEPAVNALVATHGALLGTGSLRVCFAREGQRIK